MNHCPVSADEGRHAHEQGQQEALQARIETEADAIIDQLQADLNSIRSENGKRVMTVTGHTAALLMIMFDESDVYSMAEQIARIDMENTDEI